MAMSLLANLRAAATLTYEDVAAGEGKRLSIRAFARDEATAPSLTSKGSKRGWWDPSGPCEFGPKKRSQIEHHYAGPVKTVSRPIVTTSACRIIAPVCRNGSILLLANDRLFLAYSFNRF